LPENGAPNGGEVELDGEFAVQSAKGRKGLFLGLKNKTPDGICRPVS